MKTELIEKLALIYVQANLANGDPPTKAYELYEAATKEIKSKISAGVDNRTLSKDWSL